jgi:hypothetical protein
MTASTSPPKGGAQCASSARRDLRGGLPEPIKAKGSPYRDLVAGGIPAHGTQRSAWDAGCRFDYPNPDYR